MEPSRRRPVRKSTKNLQLSYFDSVVENESTFYFGFDSTRPKNLNTFMDWDDTDEDNDYPPPLDDDEEEEEEFPETPGTPHYVYSPLSENEDEEFPETPETPEPKRQQDWGNLKPKTCPQNQTLGLKPLSFAPPVSFRPAAFFPVKPVSVPKSAQPEEIKPLGKGKQNSTALDEPTSTSESTSVENAEALQVENTALKSEVERLKELLQQKDQKLADAALKADHFEEQMSHKTELLAKERLLNDHQLALTEAKNHLAKEREENTSLKQQMAELRKVHEQDKAATEKNFLEALSNNAKSMEQLRETITEKETIMSKFEKVSRTRIVKLLGQIDDLKMEQRKKDYMLREAARKADELVEEMSQERQQWQEEKSSVFKEMAQLKSAQEDKETQVTESKRVSKKKMVQLLRQMHDLKVQHEQEHLDLTSKWEMEKECLLNYHELTLTEALTQLAKEREENTSIKQEMAELRKAHEEDKAATEKNFLELRSNNEKGMEQLRETIREKDVILSNSVRVSKKKIVQLQNQIEGLERKQQQERLELTTNLEKEKGDLQYHYAMMLETEQDQMDEDREAWNREKDSMLEKIAELERKCEEQKAACYQSEKNISELLSNNKKAMGKLKETIKEKDAVISNSKVILREKLEQKDKQLETVKKASDKKNLDLSMKLHQVEEELKQERVKTNQARHSFDLEVEESTKLRAALVQKELEGQQQLEEERQQLEEEKSTLSQQIAHLKKVVKKKKTIIRKTQEDFQLQVHQLQQQVDELKEKTTKKNVGRRFLNLFRRSRKKRLSGPPTTALEREPSTPTPPQP
ncbi:interaptin-like [Oryzias latipes]|uniref:interaptin-like n=1 Tax=Oryzias latipes TaxID=8090 RepID=UPI000CE220A4|nr:interaptin-like [Oryzias latipes]